jgi:hypothetical protein
MSSFGLIEKIMELSDIYLAVTKNGKALVFPHGNSLAFDFCHGLRTHDG